MDWIMQHKVSGLWEYVSYVFFQISKKTHAVLTFLYNRHLKSRQQKFSPRCFEMTSQLCPGSNWETHTVCDTERQTTLLLQQQATYRHSVHAMRPINTEYTTTKISAVTKLLFHFSDLITSNDMKTITTIHSIYNHSIHMQQNKQTTPTMHVSRVVMVLCHVIRVSKQYSINIRLDLNRI